MTMLDDITLVAGDSTNLVFTLTDASGDPLDPTAEALTIKWAALDPVTQTAFNADPGDISNIANVVTVRIPPDTLINVGRWNHELELSDATRQFTPAQGAIVVTQQIIT